MSDGGRDAGFWILLVIAAVTAVCAAYTLLTAAGLLGNPASGAEDPAGSSQPETTAGGTRPETTDHVAVPEKTDAAERSDPAETTEPDAASADLVTAVGDSTMLGAVDALRLEIPNLALVDAQGSRQPSATIDLLRQYRADGHLGDVVVVHVGNNGPFTADEFDEMMDVLSGVRKVLVVNLTVPPDVEDPIAVPNDAVLAEGARRYEKAVLVDWYSASAGHPGYLWDGVHLTFRGARAYADLISSRLQDPEGPVELPGPRESFSWGTGGLSGVCVGPPSWCRGVARS